MPKSQKGFTLIELLVVVTIISILVAIGAVSYSQAQKRARNAQRQSDLKKISIALEHYFADHRKYPTGGPGGQFTNCLAGSSASPCEAPFNVYLTQTPTDPLGTAYTYTPAASVQSYTIAVPSPNSDNFTYSINSPTQ